MQQARAATTRAELILCSDCKHSSGSWDYTRGRCKCTLCISRLVVWLRDTQECTTLLISNTASDLGDLNTRSTNLRLEVRMNGAQCELISFGRIFTVMPCPLGRQSSLGCKSSPTHWQDSDRQGCAMLLSGTLSGGVIFVGGQTVCRFTERRGLIVFQSRVEIKV